MFAKGILVLCTGLLALASTSMESRHAFRAGHEYSYDYNGQIATSLSNGEQHSASRFRTLVKLNFVSDNSIIVRLEHPQMGQWNDYLDQPQQLHRFDKFERVEIKAEHAEKLTLPFQCRWSNGKISELTFHAGDDTFSENIKRAIMNTLQVQLQESRDFGDVEDRETSESYGFRLNETTIEGDCESLYTVRKTESSSENVDTYNVTKSIDFTQCRYRPELRYNYFRFAEPMEPSMYHGKNIDEQTTRRMIHSNPALDISSVYEFTLNGDRRQFLVKDSKVLSTYTYEMIDGERVRMVTYAIAQASLKNAERKEAADSLQSSKSATTLVYSNHLDVLREKFIAEGDEAYLHKNPYMKVPNAATIVSNIMKRLLESSTKNSVEGIDEQATRYLSQLVSILRLSSRSDIEKIHQELFESDAHSGLQKTFMQGILADTLAIAGTKNTIDHLFKKIQNGHVSTMKAAGAISKLMNLRIVSADTVRNLEKLCQESKLQESSYLKRTCMLTYGALVNAMCTIDSPLKHSDKYTTEMAGKYCDESMKSEIAKQVKASYNKASTRAEKVLVLKTIGNMGLKNTVTFLDEIISDWNVEKVIRIQAIDALRQIRKEVPHKVQSILLPVIQNRREHPEVRMNALYQLLHSQPEKAVLDIIMTEMIREPNTHVKSFVNQLVHQMIEGSQDMYDQETATTLRSMLKHLNMFSDDEGRTPLFTSKFYSSVVSVDHSQLHDLASQLNLAALFSNDSRLPKEIMATVNLLAKNRMIPNTYQLGVHSQDIEQLFERIINSLGSKDFDEVVVRGRRSITEESVNFLKGIYNRMKIATRRRSSEDATPMMLLYFRHQDMDTWFCLTDEESLPQLLQTFIVDGRIDVAPWEHKNLKFNWASASYGYEQQIKTPTIAGMPVITTIRIPTLSVIDGSISTSFSDNKDEDRVRSARVQLKVEPKIATTIIVKMEVFSPLFTSGVKTFHSAQLRLPLHLVGKAHAPHWTPELEIHMPTEEIRVIHLQSRPVTFYRVWPAKSGMFIEATEKTLLVQETSNNALKQFHTSHADPFLGLNLMVDSHWHSSPGQLIASRKFIGDWLLSGENSFELKVQPTADSAKVLKLSIKDKSSTTKENHNMKMDDIEQLFGSETKKMLAHTHKDELQLIREQMKVASGRLNKFHHFVFKAETAKGSRPRVATFDMKSLCDDRMNLCILSNHIDIDSEWTLKANVQLAMPEVRGVVAGFPSRHLIAKIDGQLGEENKVSMNIYGRPSQQRIACAKTFTNERDEKNIENDDEDVFESAPHVLKPNDYIMVIEKKLSQKSRTYIRKLANYLSWSQWINIPEGKLLEEEKMEKKQHQTVMARLILDENNYNLTMSMPNQKYEMNWDNSDDDSQSSSRARGIFDVLRRSSNNDEATCTIKKGKFIKSFDGKTYKLPMTNCYTILAKDCTEQPRFVLMAKKLNKYDEELKMKMVMEHKSFELYKENDKMVVKVDKHFVKEEDFEEHGIHKVADRKDLYEIRCSDTDASVRFDGANILARIGSEYVHRQCGVCGHLNYDQSDDLRKANNEEAKNLRDFHQSYLYTDAEECDASALQEIKKDSSEEGQDEQYREDFTEDMENRENITPIRKTITIENHGRICFSESPIKQCPEGSHKSRSQSEQVNFICMSRNQHKAQRILRQLRSQNTVELSDDRSNSNAEKHRVEIPSHCVSSDAMDSSSDDMSRRSQFKNDQQRSPLL